ncbi:hypothetical protein GCM10028805_39130 [Spirosoma harenae]
MRSVLALKFLLLIYLLTGCVDPDGALVFSRVNTIVVDGVITNLAEPQLIRLNQSKADPLTGRYGTIPLSKAAVDVVVDSMEVIRFQETDPGRYQAPDGFIGQIGHSYQLRFVLSDGRSYESTQQVMQAVPPIARVYATFNSKSLAPAQQLDGGYVAAHDFFIDWQDPVNQHNYYRWDWIDWERQEWCHSCHGGLYQITDANGNLIEDCVNEKFTYPYYDYNCRTACWEIIHSSQLNVLDDVYSNGGTVKARLVAQVPLYWKQHCLIEIRQSSLSESAYTYLKKLRDQTQNTGGVADAPGSIPVGNVKNRTTPNELVVGYFTASAVSAQRYWLTRNDAVGFTPGLFKALNGHDPIGEPSSSARYRPPLAVCAPSDSRTPIKPTGWQD